MKGLLLSGGSSPSQELLKKEIDWADVIVCADHGYDMIRPLQVVPDLLVGDFDSLEDRDYPSTLKVETHIPNKNETDTELALDRLIDFGANEIHILGGLGTRMDHTIGNIYLLERFIGKNFNIYILDDRNKISIRGKGVHIFLKDKFQYISLIPLSEEIVFSSQGLKYEVENLEIKRGKPRGISNEISDSKALISIHSGLALIIESID